MREGEAGVKDISEEVVAEGLAARSGSGSRSLEEEGGGEVIFEV